MNEIARKNSSKTENARLESEKTAYIYGAGEYKKTPFFPENGFIIAADGGFEILKNNGIIPGLLIGDFDSLEYVPDNDRKTEVIKLPKMKDITDIGAAIAEAKRRGFSRFHIFGGTGGRLDHTLGNIAILADISKNGGEAFLWGDDFVITAITNREFLVPEAAESLLFDSNALSENSAQTENKNAPRSRENRTVSVFAWGGDAFGVTLKGFLYPLSEATLTPFFPLGISNEICEKDAAISVRSGTLVVLIQT
jgi:thiamine pyrophosphokinase